jgi:predicted transposase/invertase (TIGR01784 family)
LKAASLLAQTTANNRKRDGNSPMKKQRYISPFTDFGFKKLFGEEAHKNLLIDFLNALLPAKHRISDLEYTKQESSGATAIDRRAVFDIACTGTNGERFIVELQKAKQNFFKDRSVFYATFPIREQAERGDVWDFELAAVYCIGILDFVFDDESDDESDENTSIESGSAIGLARDYLHHVQLKNQRNRVFYDKLMFVYLEMPKFTKTEAELRSQTDKWLYFIKHLNRFDDVPAALQEKIFEEAFRVAEIAQFNPAQIQAYETSLKHYRDMHNVLSQATDRAREEGLAAGLEEGLAAGLEQGLEQGREQGLEQGREQGRAEGERQALLEVARRLKALGLAPAEIAQTTGLSLDEITSV